MNARDFALIQLDRTRLPGWLINQARLKGDPPTDPRDLNLAEQIRVGVIKNFALLEHCIEHYTTKSRIDSLVRKILAVGLYQLRFLDRVPASAVVDQAVEQTRRLHRRHSTGFVNAVLRRATREPDVPLPDVRDDPIGYATIVLSHPAELVARLVELLGVEGMIVFCRHSNIEPPTLVRMYRGVTIEQLATPELEITPHEQPQLVVVKNARRPVLAEWARAGLAQVQDATAAGVVSHLGLATGQDVLDRCAGMGTKSLQIQDELGGSGWIMAIEPSPERCDALRELLQARRIENLAVVQARMLREITELKRPAFDRILIDVPCSNSGVLARRAEARYAQTDQSLESLSQLQDQIMDDSAPYLRSGGLIVYSTCSIWPAENQHRIERFLAAHCDFEQLHAHATLPSTTQVWSRYHDGGFVSVLKRR